MAYAADTRSWPNIVEHARNADLLVHEAYGSEDDAKWAHAFGHSTAAEAGRIARDSGAKRLVLTHFRASRFADPKDLAAEAALPFGGTVEVARDLEAFDF
jgi:ribonuclease Z